MSALVTILLPVRDAAPTLGVALRSIARQREGRFECIVVDDGSQDASAAIAEERARRDPRFRVVRGEARGLVEALSRGLAQARTPFVARMDADDWMHRDRLCAQLAALEADDRLAAVGARVRLFPREGLRDGSLAYEAWLNRIEGAAGVRREAFIECPIAHPTLFARREAFEAHPYRESPWPEDYDLVLRWLAAGCEIGVVERRLLGWRDHPERLSRRSERYSLARFTACKAAYLAAGPLAHSKGYLLWGYGATAKALRRALLAHGREPSHIVEVHPRRLGQRIHGAPVIPPSHLRQLRGRPLVVSVAGSGPRGEIRQELARLGFCEGRDYVCAA